ncbi:amidohydrolase family protein [Chloroflexota bacterium]
MNTKTEREAWLDLTKEDPIDPEIPICDAHHHFWHRGNHRYFLEELLQDTGGGHHIVQTVAVECRAMYRKDGPPEMRPVGETEFIQGMAAQSASGQYGTTVVAGIVGYADLTLGAAVAPVLEAQLIAGRNRLRGIRYMTVWDASADIKASASHMAPRPGLIMESKFREGFACLQKYNLSFDAWLYHTQLMELVDLARAFPDITIIVNHIGGPLGIGPYAGRRQEVFLEWQEGIAALATCPNVTVKLGGFGVPACGSGWSERPAPPGSSELAETVAPYYLWCIKQFGVGRCMFGSNFPVDKSSCSYTVLWNAFKRISKDFSPEASRALFYDTAVKVYRLNDNHKD